MKTIACCIATTIVLLAGTVHADVILLEEHWDPPSFAINNWDPGMQWTLPSHVAQWYYPDTPEAPYWDSLTSRELAAAGCASVRLDYKVGLDVLNWLQDPPVEHLYVEVHDGSEWQTVRDHTNEEGAFGLTPMTADLTGYIDTAGDNLRVRFTAHGEAFGDIAAWEVDDIVVTGVCEVVPVPGAAVLAMLGLGVAARKLRRRRA